ncbi:MAG: tetratricopeptide repeat protein [Bacteroidota bacterium]
MKKIILVWLIVFCNVIFAQDNQPRIDSLEKVLKTCSDAKKIIDLKMEIEELRYNFDENFWIKLSNEAKLAGYTEAQAKCINNAGFILASQGKQDEAITHYQNALDLYRKIDSKKGMAGTYNDLAAIYEDIKENDKALEYYEKSYDLFTESRDSLGISLASHNLSTLYADAKDYSKSKEYALKSLGISKRINDLQGLPSILQNLGTILQHEGNLDSAMIYFRDAYSISKSTGFLPGMAFTGLSIGNAYYTKYKEGSKDHLAQNHLKDSAEYYILSSYDIGLTIQSPEIRKRASQHLMNFYASEKKWEDAYRYAKTYYGLKDTLANAEKQKDILRSQMEYEHNLEILKTEEESKAQQALSDERSKRQTYVIIGAVIIVIILAAFTVIIIRRWKLTQSQKIIIEHQKELVEEKQKEVIDSINYAQRIQNAILPSDDDWKKLFPSSFIFYQPKDIVAGDFYWCEKVNDTIFVAAADCTGHGVPGAMVSVICSNALNKTVLELGISDPGKILDQTRELVVERFSKSGKDVKDGMDISLISMNINTKKIKWAGANNPLWIVKSDESEAMSEMHSNSSPVTDHLSLIEIKPDKQPIGKTDDPKPFTTHELKIKQGDFLFLFTDGYADQFGGPKGKKFKYSNLQKLLLENSDKNPELIKQTLSDTFKVWKQDLEQVDDICIIGIKA